MSTLWDEYKLNVETWRAEYELLTRHWHFLEGARFALLGVSATGLAGLFTIYRAALPFRAWEIHESLGSQIVVPISRDVAVEPYTAVGISALVLLVLLATTGIVFALESLLDATEKRGRVLEGRLSIADGLFSSAGQSIVLIYDVDITVDRIIQMGMTLAGLVWLYLTSRALLFIIW